MAKRYRRTQRGAHYQALAEGYKVLNPTLASSFQSAAEHYDHSDLLPLELVGETRKAGGEERETTRYYVLTTRLGRASGLSVRIHTAECGYCNDGRGRLYGGVAVRGQWHGPFDYAEAVRVAKEMALLDSRPCQRCMPASLRDYEI